MSLDTQRFPSTFLFLNGLGWGLYGLYCLVQPAFVAGLLGLLETPASNTEFHAMYGGLQAGLGLYWVTASLQPRRRECGLLGFVLVVGSLAGGRAIGLFLNGPDPYNNWAFAYEFAALLVGLYCLIRIRLQPA